MPTITLELIDHLVFFFLLAVGPWNGARRFRMVTRSVEAGDQSARKRLYRTILIEKWALTGVIAAAWVVLSRSAASIGLGPITELTPLVIAGFTITGLAIGALGLYVRSVTRNEEMRIRTHKAIAPVRAMVPHTLTERRWFEAVSVTAGITEELIFRGFLFAYFAALIPGMPTFAVVLFAGLVFGLGHAYQGVPGIVKTGTLGVLFGVLYWMTGSIGVPMLLHAAIDLTSGWISWQVASDPDLNAKIEPASV